MGRAHFSRRVPDNKLDHEGIVTLQPGLACLAALELLDLSRTSGAVPLVEGRSLSYRHGFFVVVADNPLGAPGMTALGAACAPLVSLKTLKLTGESPRMFCNCVHVRWCGPPFFWSVAHCVGDSMPIGSCGRTEFGGLCAPLLPCIDLAHHRSYVPPLTSTATR